MKNIKTIILLLLLILSINSYSQLSVTTSKSTTLYSNISSTKLTKFETEEHVFYALYFRNTKYTSIIDIEYIKFDDIDELTQFLDLCENSLETKEKFTTSKYSITKLMGSAFIMTSERATFSLSKSVIEKIRSSIN